MTVEFNQVNSALLCKKVPLLVLGMYDFRVVVLIHVGIVVFIVSQNWLFMIHRSMQSVLYIAQ